MFNRKMVYTWPKCVLFEIFRGWWGGGEDIYNVLKIGEAQLRGPTPYPFVYHFDRKGMPFVYLNPFQILSGLVGIMNKSPKRKSCYICFMNCLMIQPQFASVRKACILTHSPLKTAKWQISLPFHTPQLLKSLPLVYLKPVKGSSCGVFPCSWVSMPRTQLKNNSKTIQCINKTLLQVLGLQVFPNFNIWWNFNSAQIYRA